MKKKREIVASQKLGGTLTSASSIAFNLTTSVLSRLNQVTPQYKELSMKNIEFLAIQDAKPNLGPGISRLTITHHHEVPRPAH